MSDHLQISREELLGGLPARRASTLLFAIESRTAQLVSKAKQATVLYLTPKAAEEREREFLEAIAAGRDLPVQPTIQDLERYAPHWASLVPEDSGVRAAIARMVGNKYRFAEQDVPQLQLALGLNDGAVQQAFQRLYSEPLESIYTPRISVGERLRWRWAKLAGWLENLPPFWLTCILTVIIGAVTLALPIAVVGVGPLPGIVMIIVIGLINMLTIAAMAETVTRSGDIRYGSAFIGRIVADYLGQSSSALLSIVLVAFSFGLLLVFYLGISTTLEGASGLPAEIWMVLLFLIGLYFLTRSSLNATLALTIIIGLANILLLLILSLLAFTHLRLENLLYINVPWFNEKPFDPTALSFIIGVVMGIYSSHILVVIFGKLLLQRDPGGHAVIKGHTAGIGVAIILNVIWVLAASGAVAPRVLAEQPGTVLVPLTAIIGPVMGVLGAIFVIISMGLGFVQFSIALYNLARERVDTPRTAALGQQGRFFLALSPAILVFLLAEWLSWTNTGSFTGILAILGVIVDSLMTGIFPILLLAASRRKGELVPQVVYRFLGNPLLLTGIYLLFLFNLFFHGLVIWQNPLQRLIGIAIALLMLGVTIAMIRRGAFSPRLVIELREDQSLGGRNIFHITDSGQPAAATVQLHYPDELQQLQGMGEVQNFSQLRNVTVQLPASSADQLKVWVHRITPEGDSERLPAQVSIYRGTEEKKINLNSSTGMTTLLFDGDGGLALEISLVSEND